MNRIYKFRAWDGFNKKMSYWTMNDLCTWDNKEEKPSALDEWMQYTNLKDKNGKEIYESDRITFNGQPKESVVEWLDNVGCWGINGHPIGAAAKMSEVIGNIYETPNLLN